MRNRIMRYGVGCAVLVLGAALWLSLRPSAKYNVVVVTLDTTRADRIGCYGYAKAKTSALDELAARGVVFERAFAPVPVTLPSHISMFTGLYPPEHGVHSNGRAGLGKGIPVLAEILRDADYETAAFISGFPLKSKFGLDRGFRTYDDDLSGNVPVNPAHDQRRSGRSVMDAALAWLQGHSSRPFFCWIHFYDPHFPYDARREAFGDEFVDAPYDAGIAFADLQIQRLAQFLRDAGIVDRTLVVVAGDHGESLGEHDEREHGYQLYDCTLRVPLIFAGPPCPLSGRREPTPVSLVDLMPTVLDCLGLPMRSSTSGRSVKSALSGNGIPTRPCYAETDIPFLDNRWAPLRSIIVDGWKYIETTRDELYDRLHDPQELHDLAPAESAKRAELRTMLRELTARMTRREGSAVNLTPEERRVLESLGYAAGGAGPSADAAGERLPDVKDMMRQYDKWVAAGLLIQEDKVGEAIVNLRDLVAAAPDFLAAKMLLADALVQARKFDEAGSIYEELLTVRPDWQAVHARLAGTLTYQGRLPEAIGHYRQALESDPDATGLRFNYARTLLALGKRAEAIGEFQETLRTEPKFVEARMQLAGLLAQSGRPQEALEHFRTVLELDPTSVLAQVNAGSILAQLSRYAEALEHLTKAVELDPKSFEARYTLATVLLVRNRSPEAIVHLVEAVKLRPDDSAARDLLERVSAELQRRQPSREKP